MHSEIASINPASPSFQAAQKTCGKLLLGGTDEVVAAWSRLDSPARDDSQAGVPSVKVGERLREVGERRIAAMDEAGLAVQVISLTSPGLRNLPADEATRLQVGTNDRIAELVNAYPDRFQGPPRSPPPAPAAAA